MGQKNLAVNYKKLLLKRQKYSCDGEVLYYLQSHVKPTSTFCRSASSLSKCHCTQRHTLSSILSFFFNALEPFLLPSVLLWTVLFNKPAHQELSICQHSGYVSAAHTSSDPPRKTTMLSHLFSRLDLSYPLCPSDAFRVCWRCYLMIWLSAKWDSVSSFSHVYSFVPGHQLFLHQLTPDNVMLLSRGVDWHLFSWIQLFFFIFGLRKGQWLQDYT